MHMSGFRQVFLLSLLLAALSPGVRATQIFYEVKDLADPAPGQDLWQYRYGLSGLSSGAEGLDVYFRLTGGFQPGDLSNPTRPNGDWDVLVIQPDPGLSTDGFFDAARLAASPQLPTLPNTYFRVDFIWRGPGVPGSQDFEIHDASFAVINSGRTTPLTQSVPEPTVPVLLLAGGFVLAAACLRDRRNYPVFIHRWSPSEEGLQRNRLSVFF